MEISKELYQVFREFEKQDKREQNFFDRHIEHSELTDETLGKRVLHLPKGMEECICDKEDSKRLWIAIGELPEKQRRRFLLYFDFGLTYERIAEMEGCTKMAVKFSIDTAKKNISKKIKKFLF